MLQNVFITWTTIVLLVSPVPQIGAASTCQGNTGAMECHDKNAWYVGFNKAEAVLDFDDTAASNIFLTYNGPEPLDNSKYYVMRVMDRTCSRFIAGGAITPTTSDGEIPKSAYNAGLITAELKLNTRTIQSSPEFYIPGTSPSNFNISFCARMELRNGDDMTAAMENTKLNFAVNTTQDFMVTDLNLVKEDETVANEVVLTDFPLSIYTCDKFSVKKPVSGIRPGENIQLCIESGSTEAQVTELRSVTFRNDKDTSLTIPVVDFKGQPSNLRTELKCVNGICNLMTMALARLYEQPKETGEVVDIHDESKLVGVAVLRFVTGRNRGRVLQVGQKTGSSRFETSFDLATPPPPDSAAFVKNSYLDFLVLLVGMLWGFMM